MHAIHRDIRTVIDEYPGAVTVGEVWVHDNARWAEYLRPDELHLGFNFRLARTEFDAAEIRDAVANSWPPRRCRTRPQPGRWPITMWDGRLAATAAARSGCAGPRRWRW